MAEIPINSLPVSRCQEWPDSVTRLYVDNYDMLMRAALRYLDAPHLGEEAIHEAFIRFTSRSPNHLRSERAYLRTIVVNVAKSMLRRRQCAERWRPEDPDHDLTPDDICAIRDESQRIRLACQKLPEKQRMVVELRYWQNLSEEEIANRLSMSQGSVKTHASRARHALRHSLAEIAS